MVEQRGEISVATQNACHSERSEESPYFDRVAARADSFASLRNEKQIVAEIDEADDDFTPFDKLREECGVMAVYGHDDAARMTY
jgi:hypothetical protein